MKFTPGLGYSFTAMNSMTAADELIARNYLLGKLTDEDRATVEDRYFADNQYFEQMRRLEQELIRRYVRGSLDPSVRDDFDEAIVRLPALRRKLLSHAGLSWRSLRPLAIACSVTIAALLGTGYWMHQSELKTARAEVQAWQRRFESMANRPATVIMVWPLWPSAVRRAPESAGSLPNALQIPASVAAVRFRLYLPASAGPGRYLVVLRRTGDNTALTAAEGREPERTHAGWAVDFDCPASVLSRGDYTVSVSRSQSAEQYTYRVFSDVR